MKLHKLVLFTVLGVLLTAASAFLPEDAAAATRPYNFGLTQKWSQCSGPGRFNILMTWTPVSDSTTDAYAFASGNKCQLRNVTCGTHGGCGEVICKGRGPCEAEFGQCQQGRGGSWIRVTSPGRLQNVAISGPRLCK